MEYDKNAPAFAPVEEDKKTVGDFITDESTDETTDEGTPTASGDEAESEKPRVPYSRFEKKNQEAAEARREAEYWRQEAERASQSTSFKNESDEELPSYWVELFGDTEASKKAFKADQQRISKIEERAEQRAIEAIENRQRTEESKFSSNLNSIESRIESLSDFIGRELTESEENALLDIVDDYTPKGEDGKYAGELISFDKAWQIYEMQQMQNSARTSRSRNAVASASGASSKGEPAAESKNFNPQQWGSWRTRLK